jgi:hypothetical protein
MFVILWMSYSFVQNNLRITTARIYELAAYIYLQPLCLVCGKGQLQLDLQGRHSV